MPARFAKKEVMNGYNSKGGVDLSADGENFCGRR
jgi:hypothetical protein